jgi:ubiquinone/menaquinone biosynthesis C-methylase UbiE
MTAEPALRAAGRRPTAYSAGTSSRWRTRIFEPVADAALAAMPSPLDMLDVGCGSGALLRELVVRVPYGESFVGVDPRPEALATARRMSDRRITFLRAAAETLPFESASFDLVITTGSFAYWSDQAAGVRELARVVRANGRVVLVEATGILSRGGHDRSPQRIRELLEGAGLRVQRRETLYRSAFTLPLVRAFIASG